MLKLIKDQSQTAVSELINIASPKANDILVIGCSTSEVSGHKIGTYSSSDIAQAIFEGVSPIIEIHQLFLAVQCCEHLNRAIIIESNALSLYKLEPVNVVPQPKAGGSFATVAYNSFKSPVAVEFISALCGIDIGGTLIGMHLKHVAVPVRLSLDKIGNANIICARTRPKFIGGERANYNQYIL